MSGDNPFGVSSDSYGDRSGRERSPVVAEVSPRTIEMLNQTRPWVQLMGVLLWIGTVLMGLGSIAVVFAALMSGQEIMVVVGALYVVGAIVYGVLAKSLTGYASRINSLRASERVDDLEDALESQKTFCKVCGIITLIGIVIYLLGIVLVVSGAIALNQFATP